MDEIALNVSELDDSSTIVVEKQPSDIEEEKLTRFISAVAGTAIHNFRERNFLNTEKSVHSSPKLNCIWPSWVKYQY